MPLKPTHIALIVVFIAIVSGGALTFTHREKSKSLLESCPTDTMMCSDGSTVPRSGPTCEFGVCKDSSVSTGLTSSSSLSLPPSVTPDFTARKPLPPKVESAAQKKLTPKGILQLGKETASSLVKSVGSSFSNATQNTNQNNTASSQVTTPSLTTTAPQNPSPSLHETNLTVVGNTIINEQGQVVATIPVTTGAGSSWETHTVSVIEVGSTTPVIGGVPVIGSTGKYYISENSFGSLLLCEFSNKISILDTQTETKTLLYEENSSTLSKDDPRACTSEMILLATEEEKLVLKYHTIQTNSLCDSSWSEPEKTWYLDVTKLPDGMKKYLIPLDRYNAAEAEEALCRQNL